jgi:hypothetical protein
VSDNRICKKRQRHLDHFFSLSSASRPLSKRSMGARRLADLSFLDKREHMMLEIFLKTQRILDPFTIAEYLFLWQTLILNSRMELIL